MNDQLYHQQCDRGEPTQHHGDRVEAHHIHQLLRNLNVRGIDGQGDPGSIYCLPDFGEGLVDISVNTQQRHSGTLGPVGQLRQSFGSDISVTAPTTVGSIELS